MFLAGRYGIASYLAYAAPASTYGAAGSLVVFLLWVYYSSLILFFGAALTKARVVAGGREIVPRATAVLVIEEIGTTAVPLAHRRDSFNGIIGAMFR